MGKSLQRSFPHSRCSASARRSATAATSAAPVLHFSLPSRRSGSIWLLPRRSRLARVRRVCTRLESHYGRPRLGNPKDPLDDLIFIILSNRTSPARATGAYKLLKQANPDWEGIIRRPESWLTARLEPIGLSKKRSAQIRSILREVRRDFGSCSLAPLRRRDDDAVHAYLTSLPGVSDKVAKCVMLYTLGRKVLPVDTHVHRVSVRLGWADRKRADQCHEELEALVSPDLRYVFHVTCIAHGRAVCRGGRPLCERCVVRRDCDYYKSRSGAK